MNSPLEVWTVYDHPSDDPTVYLARCFQVTAAGPVRTVRTLRAQGLEDIRLELEAMGLVSLQRSPEDDPVIIETWV